MRCFTSDKKICLDSVVLALQLQYSAGLLDFTWRTARPADESTIAAGDRFASILLFNFELKESYDTQRGTCEVP